MTRRSRHTDLSRDKKNLRLVYHQLLNQTEAIKRVNNWGLFREQSSPHFNKDVNIMVAIKEACLSRGTCFFSFYCTISCFSDIN